jgi:hypothetical protein
VAKKKTKRVKPRSPAGRALAEMGVKPKVIPNHKPVFKPKVDDDY